MNARSVREAALNLAARDPDLRRILRANGPPPLWARKPGFQTLIQIILEQQVSLASARATFLRLARGVTPFTPGRFVALGTNHLRSLGLTRQKAAYCLHVAEAVREGRVDLKAVARMEDAAVLAALTQLKGVGPWTATIYLVMALRRPDVWPSGDLALVHAVWRVKRLRNHPSPERVARIAEAWRPFRSVAARMMWHDYLAQRSRTRRSTPGRDSWPRVSTRSSSS
jgi:DNA-3-methyladenine glycosylase II